MEALRGIFEVLQDHLLILNQAGKCPGFSAMPQEKQEAIIEFVSCGLDFDRRQTDPVEFQEMLTRIREVEGDENLAMPLLVRVLTARKSWGS